MAILTESGIRDVIRSRTGDNNSSNYLMSDDQMDERITAAVRRLVKYSRIEAEDTSLSGNSGYEYTIPAAIDPRTITSIWLQEGTDLATRREVQKVLSHHGKLIFPAAVPSGTTIILWYWEPYVVGTSNIPDLAAEILYSLMEIEWMKFAINRRSDFEQWASTERADTNIAELVQAKREIERNLQEYANETSKTLEVTDVFGGV